MVIEDGRGNIKLPKKLIAAARQSLTPLSVHYIHPSFCQAG